MTTLEHYIERPYRLEIVWDQPEEPDAPGWVANIYELDGCQAQGDTAEELAANIRRAMEAWVDAELENGHDIPAPGDDSECGITLVDMAPLIVIQNGPDLATRYRELLLALAHVAQPAIVAS